MSIQLWYRRIICGVLIILLLSLMGFADVTPVHAVSVVVNTTNDDEDVADTLCSIREAISAIKTSSSSYYGCTGGDVSAVITVSAGIYTIEKQLPSIGTTIIINGASADTTTLQASSCNPVTETCTNNHELFWVSSAGHLTLTNMTLRYGQNYDDLNGGVIYNAGTLEISNSVFIENRGAAGGAIYNAGTLNVTDSTFSLNTAQNVGGYMDGGAIANGSVATATIERSTFSGNSGRFGGAIHSNGTLSLLNSTFSGNSATVRGGGVYNNATINLVHCTFSDNTSSFGGAGVENASAGTLNYVNTIIANSSGGSDCNNESGTIGNNDKNIVEVGNCNAEYSDDPLLGPLADNGGPTLTHAILIGSIAIDNAFYFACQPTDQRGVDRPQGDGCDIGAYEIEGVFFYLPLVLLQ